MAGIRGVSKDVYTYYKRRYTQVAYTSTNKKLAGITSVSLERETIENTLKRSNTPITGGFFLHNYPKTHLTACEPPPKTANWWGICPAGTAFLLFESKSLYFQAKLQAFIGIVQGFSRKFFI